MSTQSYDFMKRYAPLFAFAAVEKVKSDIREPVIQVAIGFPLGFFDRAVKEIAPLLRTITVSGHTIRMEPLCYPQGYGVLADYRLNEAGSKMPGTERNLLIVDVGFNTIDICSVEEGRFVKNGTGTLDRRGVAYITDSIRRTLAANYMTTISDQESIEVLRTGHFSHYGQSIDCSDLVNDAVAAYGEWLFNELAAKWEERIRRSDLIILGGGGAYVLKDFIPERYRHMVRVPKDPEYSNARGYLKIMALVVAGRTV
jgi:plasmid segregation protein ParM